MVNEEKSEVRKILILGVNGFIGSHLLRRLIERTQDIVVGLDLHDYNILDLLEHQQFTFFQGDLAESHDWVEEQIEACDVIIPLIAIAQPKLYVEQPLRVFELDFEENLRIVRWTSLFRKRLIFPSTSEVYGMSTDNKFSEESSNFVYGPIHKSRWIYASSKQLLDRVIYAYGQDSNLNFTIFRPFNWIGPRQDTLEAAKLGHTRVMTQFFRNLLHNEPILLVNGGIQKRSFTDIDDGIDALTGILDNPQASLGKIFNIGNPANVVSISDLARLVRKVYGEMAGIAGIDLPPIETVDDETYYGSNVGFQDIEHRVPDIGSISRSIDWHPKVDLEHSIYKCAKFYLEK